MYYIISHAIDLQRERLNSFEKLKISSTKILLVKSLDLNCNDAIHIEDNLKAFPRFHRATEVGFQVYIETDI